MLKKVSLIWIWLISMNVNSQTLKSWTLDSFEVNLIRYETVHESQGIFPLEKPSRFYSLIEIRKHGKIVSMGGNYTLSKDSCSIKFFELPDPRIKNGNVGTFYTLGLCTKKITAKMIRLPILQSLQSEWTFCCSTFRKGWKNGFAPQNDWGFFNIF